MGILVLTDFHYFVFLIILLPCANSASVLQSSRRSSVQLGSLLFNQNEQLKKYAGNGNDKMINFQECLKQESTWNQASYLFSIEGEDISLSCSSCIPNGEPVHWKKLSFEGDESAIISGSAYIEQGRNLLLKTLEPEVANYYCFWEYYFQEQEIPIVTTVWTVETVPIENLEKLKFRQWRKNHTRNADMRRVTLFDGSANLQVKTDWKAWSKCSKCGTVGKRYQVGFCTVESVSPSSILQAFSIYKNPISCTLLLDFHPEVISDGISFAKFDESQEQVHEFARKHVIVVGYCKMSVCSGWEAPGQILTKKLYKEMSLQGDRAVTGIRGQSVMSLFRSLWRGVPIGWSNFTEILALASLVGIQCYIIILILRHRKEAGLK